MPNKLDLEGKKFGRLTVAFQVESDKSKHSYWLCLCECGKRIVTRGAYLNRGQSRSCGCLRDDMAEISNAKRFKNPEGRTFGRLKVGEMWKKIGNVFYWETRCECGRFFIANGSKLKDGTTRSCGCRKGELISEANRRRMLNQKRCSNGQFAVA